MVTLKRQICFAILTLGFPFSNMGYAEDPWIEDYHTAEALAVESAKALLLFFTGSDWCLWCRKLEREVLSEEALSTAISEVAIPLRIDFPQRMKLPPKQRRSNAKLKDAWKVESIPSVILYDPISGKELWRHGYARLDAADYAISIRKALNQSRGLDKDVVSQ
jgi:protein disulfide-isomerase